MHRTQLLQVFDELYQDTVGYSLSFEGRKKLGYHDSAFTYGEVVPDAFYEIVSQVNPKPGEIFYDLGSGTGKAVILAALLFDFSRVVGIEYLPDLHEAAQRVRDIFWEKFAKIVPYGKKNTNIEFMRGDFLDQDVKEADIIFAHATCFHEGIMMRLAPKLTSLKAGARVLVVTKKLDSPSFNLIDSRDYRFNWGNATVNSYIKQA